MSLDSIESPQALYLPLSPLHLINTSMMNNFVGEDEALATAASHIILETIDKKLDDAGKLDSEAKENMNDRKKRTTCRRVSVPLRLRLFYDQLRRKAEQCLEAQALAADLQLTLEFEALFGATDESTPTAGKEGEVDAHFEGRVDVAWGHNGREQEKHHQQQQPGRSNDSDTAVCGDNHGRVPSEDTTYREDAANVGGGRGGGGDGGGHLDDWEEDDEDDDDDFNVVWHNHHE